MIELKTAEQIEIMRESAMLVSKTHREVAKHIRPGITGQELDRIAEEFIRDNDAVPAFKGYDGFPSTLCISPEEEVVHGIPSKKELKEGQIISIDCGVLKNGFYGDSAFTYAVGAIDDKRKKLLQITRECLDKAIELIRPGVRLGDVGFAVQLHAERNGFSVVRELVGHGIGKNLHEKPEVPNFGSRGNGEELKAGMVIAVEPMINMGKRRVNWSDDGWTVLTSDRKPSAHFEHTVAVTEKGADVLSSFAIIDEVLN